MSNTPINLTIGRDQRKTILIEKLEGIQRLATPGTFASTNFQLNQIVEELNQVLTKLRKGEL